MVKKQIVSFVNRPLLSFALYWSGGQCMQQSDCYLLCTRHNPYILTTDGEIIASGGLCDGSRKVLDFYHTECMRIKQNCRWPRLFKQLSILEEFILNITSAREN